MSTCETQQAEHMCGGNQTADWSPLLCTQFETNAYLGLYHNTPILLADDSDYTKISASARHLSNYGYVKARVYRQVNSHESHRGIYLLFGCVFIGIKYMRHQNAINSYSGTAG